MKTILKTENLNKEYSLGSFTSKVKIQALNNINLAVESDEPVIISLVGESGSGKTTLAKTILRLIEPTSGRALVYDQVVAGAGAKQSRAEFMRTVQPIFQNHSRRSAATGRSTRTCTRRRRAWRSSTNRRRTRRSKRRWPRLAWNTPMCAASIRTSFRAANCNAHRLHAR